MNPKGKEADAISLEECWNVIERVAASTQFRRASRSREFLLYVSGKAIKEDNNDLHEQEIGHAIFGRDESYDTSQDNIVRVSASDLRKRIDSYFTTEGLEEPLIFDIPRGSYSPVFRRRNKDAVEVPVPQSVETPEAPVVVPSYRQWPFLLVSVVAVLLAIACGFLFWENFNLAQTHNSLANKPALRRLWSRFLDSPLQADVVLPDTSYGFLQEITNQTYTLSEYLNYSYITKMQASSISADRKRDLTMLMERDHSNIGDLKAMLRVWALDHASGKLSLEYARGYSADSIKRHNTILIGSQISNPWTNLFYDRMPFTIEYSASLDRSFIQNKQPQPGESAMYPVVFRPDGIVGYGIIACLPNPSHTADTLIIAGTDAQVTEATAEFATDEASLEKLFQRLPRNGSPYFEVLLKGTRLSGTPMAEEIVTVRSY
jgi:hypothetical protein